MDYLNYTFELVVLLFKDGQIKKVSKVVPQIYMVKYLEIGYSMVEALLQEGWRVYCISIENIHLERSFTSAYV
jgi:hypothetical protein